MTERVTPTSLHFPDSPSGGSVSDSSLLAQVGYVPAMSVVGLSILPLVRIEEKESTTTRFLFQEQTQRELTDSFSDRQLFRRSVELARAAAAQAMHQHAAREGLDGLLNVKFSAHPHIEGFRTPGVEFRATGQGMRRIRAAEDGSAPQTRPRGREVALPFSATFGAADLVLLSNRGFWPLQALISSVTAPYLRTVPGEQGSGAWWTAAELSALTLSTTSLRNRAVGQLQRMARELEACGLLDLQLTIGGERWLAPSHEHVATATAVRRTVPTPRPGPALLMLGLGEERAT
ncbi:hypothetical protein [Deinococcus ruber]|uniref:Uncharacterized protein n=1 Tax=Deinococcus ruber TaxID=1848197 RepID=A0A918FEF7_9DEIO|nr:hypothetical protein [Deinococcus ruber]GGR28220.1 hypothetical protein GCM10008957_44310 [Deinococcus ruber]